MSLREFHPEDHLAWHRIAGDPRVAAHTPWPALAQPEAALAWISESLRIASIAPRRSFHLVIEQYGAVVGCATLDVLSIPHRQGEIGLYLRPDRWGEGLGTEVSRLLLELAFSRLGLHRVQATTDPDNIAAKRVLEHVRMRHEGTLLDRYLVDGQWQDRDMYAITLPEWRGLPLRRVATAQAAVDLDDATEVGGGGVAASLAEPGAEAAEAVGQPEAAPPADVPHQPLPQHPAGQPAAAPAGPATAAPAERPATPPPPTGEPILTVPPADRRGPVQLPIPPQAQSPESPRPRSAGHRVAEPLEGVVILAHELDELESEQEIFGSL